MKSLKVLLLSSICCINAMGLTDEVKLEEVVVTAGGFAQNIKEAPASITVLSAEELKKDSFTALQSIARKVPGLAVIGGEDGPGSKGISIRGMEGSQTLILIDGKRSNSNGANPKGGAGDPNSNFIPPIEAIERIEVIRGPMSSLYGSDAVGGVINIITKKDFSKFSGSASISSTWQEHSGIGDGRQAEFYLNLPIYDKYLALQLWGYKKLRDEDEYKGGHQDSDKHNLTSKLWITPDENNKFWVSALREKQDYLRTIGKSAYMPATRTDLNAYDYEKKSYGVGYLGEFDNFNADISYIYDTTQRKSLFDAITRNSSGARVNKPTPAKMKNHNFNSKFNTFVGNHSFTFGYDFNKQSVKSAFIVGKESKSDIYTAKEFSMTEHALFLEDEWELMRDRLFLTLGARWTHNEYFDNHVSPRAYLVYNINQSWSLKGGVATGYKAPDVNQISPNTGTIQGGWSIVDFGNKDLKPEKSITYEVGAYYDNGDDLRGSVTVFKNEFKDKIIDTDGSAINRIPAFAGCTGAPSILCPGWGTYFNIDGVDVWGVELAGDYNILNNLNLSANYTYTHSKIKTGSPSINTPNGSMTFDQTELSRINGKALSATPEHKANLTLTYRPIKNISTFVAANYESSLTDVNFGAGNKVRENNEKIYTFDLGSSWEVSKHLNISLNAYNIFDKIRYNKDMAVYNAKGQLTDGYYIFPEEGRRFWLKVTAKW